MLLSGANVSLATEWRQRPFSPDGSKRCYCCVLTLSRPQKKLRNVATTVSRVAELFAPDNVRCCPMLLKKSQIARRQFSCCKKYDRRPPNRCGLNRVTEVASEFHLQAMRFPTFLHENRAYSQKKF